MNIPVLLQIIIGALFAPSILRGFGINLDSAQAASAAQQFTAPQVYTPTSPGAPGAVKEPQQDPTPNQILASAVDKPMNWFGIALLFFALIFVIAQVRAAAHEAEGSLKDAYGEAQRATNTLSNADSTIKNISRKIKK